MEEYSVGDWVWVRMHQSWVAGEVTERQLNYAYEPYYVIVVFRQYDEIEGTQIIRYPNIMRPMWLSKNAPLCHIDDSEAPIKVIKMMYKEDKLWAYCDLIGTSPVAQTSLDFVILSKNYNQMEDEINAML